MTKAHLCGISFNTLYQIVTNMFESYVFFIVKETHIF